MSYPAQLAFLSKLDATAFPPNTIFIFTCNAIESLEKRFLSRCRMIEFSSYGMAMRLWDCSRQSGTRKLAARSARISSGLQRTPATT
jgi:hypothetical protein